MAFFGRSKSSVGLDVGSGFVKVVEVDHSGGQPEVTRVAMRPLSPDAIVEGEIMDYGLVSDTIGGSACHPVQRPMAPSSFGSPFPSPSRPRAS